MMMTRNEFLEQAGQCINHDRAATHGDAEDSFFTIAQYWGLWLKIPVTAFDVAMMMTLFKIARIDGNPSHLDSYVDAIGYTALAGELSGGTDAR